MNLFKTEKFHWIEWIIVFFLLPFPFVNIAFVVFLVVRLDFKETVKKILFMLVIYFVLAMLALMLSDF